MDVTNWVLHMLPQCNRAVLAGHMSVDSFLTTIDREVLAQAPTPDELTPQEAKRSVVEFGLIGASIARHRQQADLRLVSSPEESFSTLTASGNSVAFAQYMQQLANRTGTGHPGRDAYASLVRWNAPDMEVRWQGQILGRLESVFNDGLVRTYTDNPGEHQFLLLLKRAEALETAANALLLPIAEGTIAVDSSEAIEAVGVAVRLLEAVHKINLEFTHNGQGGKPIFDENHFLDILRQFAVHWKTGDVPPSGAQDPEFLKRDFYLGMDFPDYARHVKRIFPALLDRERDELQDAMQLPSIPQRVAQKVAVDSQVLAHGTSPDLLGLAQSFPFLVNYYLLMRANAHVSASHLMLTKRFLFKPMRERDRLGIPDSPLVSNRSGTTGMLEQLLETLAKHRQNHAMKGFSQLPLEQLLLLSPTVANESSRSRLELPEVVDYGRVKQ